MVAEFPAQISIFIGRTCKDQAVHEQTLIYLHHILYIQKSQIQTFWQRIQDVDLSFINDGFGVMNYKVYTEYGNRGIFKDSFSKTT